MSKATLIKFYIDLKLTFSALEIFAGLTFLWGFICRISNKLCNLKPLASLDPVNCKLTIKIDLFLR